VKLRDALRQTIAGWEDDVPASWRAVLGGTQPNFANPALDDNVHSGEIIIPGRKEKRITGSPPEAHIFHFLEGTSPKKVRAVILGQEPSSDPAWVTGRAFEQGNLKEWPENNRLIAISLRRIVQALASARSHNKPYVCGDRGWKILIRDVRHGALDLEPPRELFDRLQTRGVLFLNTSLTLSVDIRNGRPKRCRSHFRLWEPLIHRPLSSLATRKAGQVVLLIWGGHALDIFKRGGIRAAAESVGNWDRRVDAVYQSTSSSHYPRRSGISSSTKSLLTRQ
jgi:uracil-DNA glycosylase